MPRWQQGSEERLKKAAMELFGERGFENTSVVEIAERAGVTTRTFFRYFPDKREVLFADAAAVRSAVVQQIVSAPDVSDPLAVVVDALCAFGWEDRGRDVHRRRWALLAANPELLERELVKNDAMAHALAAVLRGRGVAADVADLATRVGAQVFLVAYQEWLVEDEVETLPVLARSTLSLLGLMVADGSAGPPPAAPC